jgi:sarcosine oxidase
VWACGPWLAGLFGELVPITVTRQELLFFDGGPAWRSPGVPGWVDYDRAMYGTGDFDELGVKVALDHEGPPLDPDAELPAAGATEPGVRAYLAERFPALADAPLKEGRCCRYELSPDSNFFAARHPELERTWVIGGGSGHGFKHGPALAERLAGALRGGEPLPERFRLGHREAGRSFRTAGSGVAR